MRSAKPRTSLSAEESPEAEGFMNRSEKWRQEWAPFPGENGRRRYPWRGKGRVYPCKQSFRAVVCHERTYKMKADTHKSVGVCFFMIQ